MTDTLLAYHNDPKLKDQALRKIRAHQKADRIIQGVYWSKGDNGVFRGCAVGCLLEDPDGGHERYETEFGIPVQLAWLEDSIFETLDPEVAKGWPARFMAAIPVGADLTAVWPRFAVWLMIDETYGSANVTDAADVKAICERVADAYSRIADGETISDAEADEIARAAWDAWDARAAWDARDAFVTASADKLIELLKSSTVAKVEA